MCSADPSFWRQIFILIPACLHSFSGGFMVAFPAVLNPAILSPNSTDITATSDQASWIASTNGISEIIGFLIFSPIFQIFGRKVAGMGLNVIMVIGWLTLSLANSITVLVFARAIQGLSIGGIFICAITLSEYANPHRRGYFMIMKKISLGAETKDRTLQEIEDEIKGTIRDSSDADKHLLSGKVISVDT
ncbi:unnamed protein product [Parnassius apollo]|uniref:(apollo) hypothetical protein n=1 Tax=Parnassius apollo TaxID=110799 RepID=A0A8S3Y8A1_PARAO|nr:unnamed protein product [Parnassius apollo]